MGRQITMSATETAADTVEQFAADLEAVENVLEVDVAADKRAWVYVRSTSKGMDIGVLRDDWRFRIWDVSSTGEDPSISYSIEFRGRNEM